jgi:hypothetical protein
MLDTPPAGGAWSIDEHETAQQSHAASPTVRNSRNIEFICVFMAICTPDSSCRGLQET